MPGNSGLRIRASFFHPKGSFAFGKGFRSHCLIHEQHRRKRIEAQLHPSHFRRYSPKTKTLELFKHFRHFHRRIVKPTLITAGNRTKHSPRILCFVFMQRVELERPSVQARRGRGELLHEDLLLSQTFQDRDGIEKCVHTFRLYLAMRCSKTMQPFRTTISPLQRIASTHIMLLLYLPFLDQLLWQRARTLKHHLQNGDAIFCSQS